MRGVSAIGEEVNSGGGDNSGSGILVSLVSGVGSGGPIASPTSSALVEVEEGGKSMSTSVSGTTVGEGETPSGDPRVSSKYVLRIHPQGKLVGLVVERSHPQSNYHLSQNSLLRQTDQSRIVEIENVYRVVPFALLGVDGRSG